MAVKAGPIQKLVDEIEKNTASPLKSLSPKETEFSAEMARLGYPSQPPGGSSIRFTAQIITLP